MWLYGPTEDGYSLGVRKKPVKATGKKGKRAGPRKRTRRVFKTSSFSKKKLTGIEVLPILWRYLYPDAFEPLPPLPPPHGIDVASREMQGLDYDPRLRIPLDELYPFLRENVVNDPWWKEMAEHCAETGEHAAHPTYQLTSPGPYEDQLAELARDFNLPEEWVNIEDHDERDERFFEYFDYLTSVINQIMPEDLTGWFSVGMNDEGVFGVWYSECREAEEEE